MDCKYCNPFLVSTLFSDDDVDISFSEGDGITVDVNRHGIYAKTIKVNYCPMCGKDLKKGNNDKS